MIQMDITQTENFLFLKIFQHDFCTHPGADGLFFISARRHIGGWGQPEGFHIDQVQTVGTKSDGHLLVFQDLVSSAADYSILRQVLFQPCCHMGKHFLKTDHIRFFLGKFLQNHRFPEAKTVGSILVIITPYIKGH